MAQNRSTAHFQGVPPGQGQCDTPNVDVIFKSPFPGELNGKTRMPGQSLVSSEK